MADCTIISSVTFSGVSKPTRRFIRSRTGTAGQLHSCMMRNASSKRVPVVTVGISRRITSPTRSPGSFLRNAAMRSWRVSRPATLPVSSTTGKSCCEVASKASTASSSVAFAANVRNSRTIALATGNRRETSFICARAAAFDCRWIKESLRTSRDEQTERNNHIDQRAGDRDDQFLHRLFRHPFQARDTADGEQCDVGRIDPESLRRERVTELMQHYAKKEQQNKYYPACRDGRAALRIVTKGQPGDQQQKRNVDPQLNAGDAKDGN